MYWISCPYCSQATDIVDNNSVDERWKISLFHWLQTGTHACLQPPVWDILILQCILRNCKILLCGSSRADAYYITANILKTAWLRGAHGTDHAETYISILEKKFRWSTIHTKCWILRPPVLLLVYSTDGCLLEFRLRCVAHWMINNNRLALSYTPSRLW